MGARFIQDIIILHRLHGIANLNLMVILGNVNYYVSVRKE